MLEHTMYFNVSPLCEEDSSNFLDFYTRLGPCELQDPVWAKMSALAAGVNKKRKKSDPKPQAQINKCNNEKRRREQENIYIEELAELISANFADMSSLSVKPDKCAILQETVNQIRSIKQRESASQSSDPVQQGEVSSSRPTILSNEVYGPLLLEALEGFLFVVNAEGKVEHVTENVATYIKFTREEVLGKSIYNFIHHGDHARFSASLLPMSIGWASEPANKSRSFNCRLLVKPDEQDESIEEKQQRVSRYELMHISSTQLRDQVTVSDDEGGDSGPCLLCVASRISHRETTPGSSIEQFTTKLDTSGKIIGVDTSGVSATYSQFLNKDLMGRNLQDLCPQQEVNKLTSHLRDTLSAGQATSVIYKLRLGSQEKYVHVQTKSKLFKANPHSNTDTDFMMATHSIIGEHDSTNSSDPAVGGPLMTSVLNGTRNGAPTSSANEVSNASTNNALLNAANSSFTTFPLDSDFSFDLFPTSTWEVESSSNWNERPESRQSVTSVSTPTPRPPSAPAYSPAATVAQSPLAQFVTQPSPTTVPNPPTPANPYSSSFPFSPIADNFQMEEQKDTKANVLEEASTMISMADSGRLRNLLTKPSNSMDSSNDSENKNKDRILKTLLNRPDEDENKSDSRNSPRGLGGRGSLLGSSDSSKTTSAAGGNDMLRQLLNEKNDDDDIEARVGLKKQSELLSQLLKPNEPNDEPKQEPSAHDDLLLRNLGFTNSPSPPGEPARARKRPSDDRDDNPSKRTTEAVSSSGVTSGSKLCERNKMLASLLAKQPANNHLPIPPVPASVISATPQEILPKVADLNKNTTANTRIGSNLPPNLITNTRTVPRMPGPGRPPNTNYLNLTPGDNMQRTQNHQFNQIDSGQYAPATTANTDVWDMQTSSDPLLSDILDQVIDIDPDAVCNTELFNFLGSVDTAANNNFPHRGEAAKVVINRIQKSLMQFEADVNKSLSSPTISLPGTPPAYSSATMTTQSNQTGGFPQPPPTYPRTAGFHNQRGPVRTGTGTPQYAIAGGTITTPQQLLIQQRKIIQQQQEHKRRLLQQQQQQQLLIPSNAAAAEINSGLQNIDSLLNNTVAPNVSLQRSASVPESQLSPNYGGQISQQNQRLNNQQPFSPHSQLASPIGQQASFPQTTTVNNYQQGGARLSPHPPFNQQLSPRQGYPQTNAQNTK
ncbi:hypothetical protein ILUMI_24316 [Ignelater luminosus]|uniref:Nuclear receptor coactivator 2 n=1 Tax=Ignelater luminosus TaxID=2038154 RepID=A0A8K0CAS0_IGNLU|nr:hypothetical protein ILUMI_24316 [Ignelater luminosus]